MRKEAVGIVFPSTLEAEWTKSIFQSVMKDVREDFLEATDTTTITGMPFVVLCLLLATTLDRLYAGYSGSPNRDDSLLHEAIGIGAFFGSCKPHSAISGRYDRLVRSVSTLQTTSKDFRELLDEFIAYDNRSDKKP